MCIAVSLVYQFLPLFSLFHSKSEMYDVTVGQLCSTSHFDVLEYFFISIQPCTSLSSVSVYRKRFCHYFQLESHFAFHKLSAKPLSIGYVSATSTFLILDCLVLYYASVINKDIYCPKLTKPLISLQMKIHFLRLATVKMLL